MGGVNMKYEEIEEFIQGELTLFDLSTKEKEQYEKYIKKLIDHYNAYNKTNIDIKNLVIEKIEEYIEFFKLQGFDDKMSIKLTKNAIPSSDRSNLKEKLALLKVLNYEEKLVLEHPYKLRFNLNYAHARKMHFKNIEDTKHETNYTIVCESKAGFERRFQLRIDDLTDKYKVTNELKEIWLMLGTMDDEKLR